MTLSGEMSTQQDIVSSTQGTARVRKRGRVTALPPCIICGEKASGLHYGVNSCEACKVKIILV